MNRLTTTLGALLLFGCQSTGLPPEFVGTFELLTRNGNPLPAPIPVTIDSQECLNDLLSGTLTIKADSTWTESLSFRHRCGPELAEVAPPVQVDESGTVRFLGDEGRLVLVDGTGNEHILTVAGDQLHLFTPTPGAGHIFEFTYRRAGT